MDKVLDGTVRVVAPESEWNGKTGYVTGKNEPFVMVKFNYWSGEVDGFASTEVVFAEEELEDVRTLAQMEASMFADFERYGTD